MKIALVFDVKGEALKNNMMRMQDSLSVDLFTDVGKFISDCSINSKVYDRIVVKSSLLADTSNLISLSNFCKDVCPSTVVLMLSQASQGNALPEAFTEMFRSPYCTPVVFKSMTMVVLGDIVNLKADELRSKYGSVQAYQYTVEETKTEYVDKEKENTETEQGVQNLEVQKESKPSKTKKGFFNNIFGKRKNNKVVEEIVIKEAEGSTEEKELIDDTQVTEEHITPNPSQEDIVADKPFEKLNVLEEDIVADKPFEELNVLEEDIVADDVLVEGTTNTEDIEPTNIEDIEPVNTGEEEISFMENLDNLDLSGDDEVVAKSDNAPVIVEGLDLFGTMNDDEIQGVSPVELVKLNKGTSQPLTEVASELEALDFTGDEKEYQKQNQKVIIKHKEVIREKGNSTLNLVYKGKLHKTIVVTGDRASGVTTLALDMAKEIAKHTSVLLFDADVVTHGLLNYLQYELFSNFEPIKQQGVKMCRGAETFNNCVMRYDTNLDILSSIYGLEVTDDELLNTQSVVSEIVNRYGVVIVDVPMSKLHLIPDLLMSGNTVLTVEGNVRGYMNTVCTMGSSELPNRLKRTLVNRGTLVVTKYPEKTSPKKLKNYVDTIIDFEDTDINWLAMDTVLREDKITDEFISKVIEK